MILLDKYRSKELCMGLAEEIRRLVTKPVRLMEVCGGHTRAIRQFGIPSLLPESLSLLSGPGCPVCVTSRQYIDQAIALADEAVICSYGDLMRVPGSASSLEQAKASGKDIRLVYSSLEALKTAITSPGRKVVFLGIGFETTAPATAAAIIRAAKLRVNNFSVLSAHKVMPPAMEAIVDAGVQIDGYICPGHVSAIAGTQMYTPMVDRYGLGCVVSGFEPLDILQSVLMLARQVITGKPKVEIQYTRAVKADGNPIALAVMNEVFETEDTWWRGLGVIKDSGLRNRADYKIFDASRVFSLPGSDLPEPEGCICGDILKGTRTPNHCRLFGKKCTPENPVGACMVSSEGTCQTYYQYEGKH